MSPPNNTKTDAAQPPTTPFSTAADIVTDIAESVPEATQTDMRVSEAIARSLSATTFDSGRSPTAVAAASLYVAGVVNRNSRLTQRSISDHIDISDVTIRNIYREVPRAAIENGVGDSVMLSEVEVKKLAYLADLSDAGDRPGWDPADPIKGGGFDE